MPFEITERNASALEPLFKPWEEPTLHRLPNPQKGEPAIIQPGRRPSKCPLVRSIRAQVDGWRRGGYAGVSDTSRTLMNFWFNTEHQVEDEDGNAIPFRYHWAQREAIETIIYLYEMRRVRNVAELLFEFGDDTIADLALGINPEEDRWAKYCSKIATGGGKTKVMSLAIVWSYFHSLYEPDSSLAQHFVIIAPNLTVYERLKDDFENCKIFYKDPLLPEDWAADFKNQMQVVLQDSSGGTSTRGAIYLTNIHRLHENRGNNGELFRHIICDFPLGEAVDAGIVKVPVLGESDELVVAGDKKTPAHERYGMHLKLGYQRYKRTFEEFGKVRKPILFVMTEDADAANEIADYLDSKQFPLLKGRVLNLHTRLKGRIKKVTRNGREIKEFVENETAMKPDDLRELREMSRELDAKDSKFRCVVSVMMLREGWDVRNVTTIVPLRPYSAKSGILPEQTLGRGLRRMFPTAETPEMVTVVHHPAFRKLYEDELAQEGLDIAVLPIREAFKQTVTIFVDHEHKPVENLEIEIPLISDAIETQNELRDLTFEEVRGYFQQRYQPLPIGRKKDGPVEYKERHLFTDEIVSRMQLEAGLLTNAWSAAGYFAQMLGRACKLSNPHQVLAPLLEQFISKVLFEREVDLYSGEVDHRMRDTDVQEHVRATFTPLILQKTVRKKDRKRISQGQPLSAWQPFQATSNDKRPAVTAKRTMFNLAPCENEFEQSFVDFCDFANDVAAFAKNAGPQKLMIDYLRPDGYRALYVPDFFVREISGDYYFVELKGKTDTLVPVKAQAASEWCKIASRKGVKWHYLYVPYPLFQQSSASTIAELARACEPSLRSLLDEAKTHQMQLPLAEETAKKEAEDFFTQICQNAGVKALPEAIDGTIRQAVALLDHAIKMRMPDLAHAFQPMLRLFDDYAIKILSQKLSPHIPARESERRDFFNPYLGAVDYRMRTPLERNQRYLQQNLIYGRPIQKLGTLLFCLDYAQQGGLSVAGVWKAVASVFADAGMKDLYEDLKKVNEVRNQHVAHSEAPLDDPEAAVEAMGDWVRCINRMAKIVV